MWGLDCGQLHLAESLLERVQVVVVDLERVDP
jgi:hypothetical protein